ncbi:hypothetical protein [Desulforhopalus singaporensis]|uniref:hypothetical protein n=1 Tax=Desulforhopalus singaporensis TaxID=91360 RepID=UPI00115F9B2D|nr:hypothetical protein [Desulforhopalus singaporensis]
MTNYVQNNHEAEKKKNRNISEKWSTVPSNFDARPPRLLLASTPLDENIGGFRILSLFGGQAAFRVAPQGAQLLI